MVDKSYRNVHPNVKEEIGTKIYGKSGSTHYPSEVISLHSISCTRINQKLMEYIFSRVTIILWLGISILPHRCVHAPFTSFETIIFMIAFNFFLFPVTGGKFIKARRMIFTSFPLWFHWMHIQMQVLTKEKLWLGVWTSRAESSFEVFRLRSPKMRSARARI